MDTYTSDLSDLATFGVHIPGSSENDLESDLGQLEAVYNGARKISDDYVAKADSLSQSNHFTEEGLNQRLGEMAEYEIRRLSDHKMVIERARKNLEELRSRLNLGSRQLDGVTAIQHMEVRNYLLSLSEEERLEVVETAVASNDGLVVDAVLTAPSALNLIPFKAREEQIRKIVSDKRNPMLAQDIDQLQAAIARAEMSLDVAIRTIKQAAGLMVDPLEEMLFEDDPEAVEEESEEAVDSLEEIAEEEEEADTEAEEAEVNVESETEASASETVEQETSESETIEEEESQAQ